MGGFYPAGGFCALYALEYAVAMLGINERRMSDFPDRVGERSNIPATVAAF